MSERLKAHQAYDIVEAVRRRKLQDILTFKASTPLVPNTQHARVKAGVEIERRGDDESQGEIKNEEHIMATSIANCEADFKERKKAVGLLTQRLMEIFVPPPHRYFLKAAETNSGPFRKMLESTESQAIEQQLPHGDITRIREAQETLVSMATRIKANVQKLMDCQRQLQEDVSAVHACLVGNILPTLPPEALPQCCQTLAKVRSHAILIDRRRRRRLE